MSDIPKIQAVTPENQEIFAQQQNTAALPLTTSEIAAFRNMIKGSGNQDASVQGGGGGGGGMSDSERVTRLETHFQYIQKDMTEIKTDLKSLSRDVTSITVILNTLPTKNDLSAWRLQWTGICIAAIALIVLGIIGGLIWIKPDPAPVIIQSAAAPNSTSPAASNRPRPATPDAPAPRP